MLGLDPTSRIALKLRRLRGRIGIAAPRVAIKTHVPWHWRLMSVLVFGALAVALAGWIYDAGSRFAGFHSEASTQELTELRARVASLSEELGQASKIANSSDSRLRIESTAQGRLASQIKTLEEENAQLKADIAIFEKLAGGEQGPPGVEISRMQVIPDGESGHYRFRMIVAQHGDVRDRDFKGSVQLLVTALRGNQPVVMEFPAKTENNANQYQVTLRRFGRTEGVFRIPEDAKIQRVESRLLEGGVVRAKSTVVL